MPGRSSTEGTASERAALSQAGSPLESDSHVA